MCQLLSPFTTWEHSKGWSLPLSCITASLDLGDIPGLPLISLAFPLRNFCRLPFFSYVKFWCFLGSLTPSSPSGSYCPCKWSLLPPLCYWMQSVCLFLPLDDCHSPPIPPNYLSGIAFWRSLSHGEVSSNCGHLHPHLPACPSRHLCYSCLNEWMTTLSKPNKHPGVILDLFPKPPLLSSYQVSLVNLLNISLRGLPSHSYCLSYLSLWLVKNLSFRIYPCPTPGHTTWEAFLKVWSWPFCLLKAPPWFSTAPLASVLPSPWSSLWPPPLQVRLSSPSSSERCPNHTDLSPWRNPLHCPAEQL